MFVLEQTRTAQHGKFHPSSHFSSYIAVTYLNNAIKYIRPSFNQLLSAPGNSHHSRKTRTPNSKHQQQQYIPSQVRLRRRHTIISLLSPSGDLPRRQLPGQA